MSTVAYLSPEEGLGIVGLIPFIFSQNEYSYYYKVPRLKQQSRPTSRSITQLSPSSVLGGLRGMLSPSGNAKMSFRSRANFFLDPAAIVEVESKATQRESRSGRQRLKTQNTCKLSHVFNFRLSIPRQVEPVIHCRHSACTVQYKR